VFIEAKDDGGGCDNWTTGAISRAKLQSNRHHLEVNLRKHEKDFKEMASISVSQVKYVQM